MDRAAKENYQDYEIMEMKNDQDTAAQDRIAVLRANIAAMKAAPFTSKASHAEKTIDAALAVIVAQQVEINQLKEAIYGKRQ